MDYRITKRVSERCIARLLLKHAFVQVYLFVGGKLFRTSAERDGRLKAARLPPCTNRLYPKIPFDLCQKQSNSFV